MSDGLREAIDTILDCFGGADGGVSFYKLKTSLEKLECDGSDAAIQILVIVHRFARLIEACNGGPVK